MSKNATVPAALAIVGFVATTMLAAAPASAGTDDETPFDPSTYQEFEVTCTADGGRGTARGTVSRLGSPTTGYDHQVSVNEYKIEYSKGGNSANLNLGIEGDWSSGPGSSLTWWKSRDELIQDGQWHSNLTLSGPLVGSIPGPAGKTITNTFEFIFDKSGASDPRCETTTTTVH